MKYVHPDIVVGEAIPEIEPRIDQERLAIVRRWNVWWRWCMVVVLVLAAALTVKRPGLDMGIGLVGALMVLWFVPIVHPKMRTGFRKMREANRLRRDPANNPSGIPFRDHIENQVLNLSLFVFATTLMNLSSGVGGFFTFIGIYAFMAGIMVVSIGFRARQPGQISCERCSYPLVGLTLPCMCPECGVSILAAEYTTDCPRIRSPRFWRIGLTMSVLGVVLVYTSIVNPLAFYAPVPRAVLFNLAPTNRKAFERLISNPMTQEETDQLIEKLIVSDIHRDSGYMSHEQQQWLGEQFAAGLLSDEQVERVFELADDIRFTINGPATGRVGELIELGLGVTGELGAGFSMNPEYYFGGFVIGEDSTPHQRYTNSRPISLITNPFNWEQGQFSDAIIARIEARKPPVYVYIPEQMGEITIRVRLVLATPPATGPATIDWENDDQLFQSEPRWIRTMDLEHTITIESASGGDDGG